MKHIFEKVIQIYERDFKNQELSSFKKGFETCYRLFKLGYRESHQDGSIYDHGVISYNASTIQKQERLIKELELKLKNTNVRLSESNKYNKQLKDQLETFNKSMVHNSPRYFNEEHQFGYYWNHNNN